MQVLPTGTQVAEKNELTSIHTSVSDACMVDVLPWECDATKSMAGVCDDQAQERDEEKD